MNAEIPLVSIITVSLNSERTIRDTIESVLNQRYKKIEYIVVDGLSSDQTMSVVRSYEPQFMNKLYAFKVISEEDQGLYDAMNKGIKIAQGEIIGILNSDDFYMDEFVIEKVVEVMASEGSDCLYADLLFVDEFNTKKIVRRWKAKTGDFRFGWNPPHPTTFITKKTYERYGLYKYQYRLASDYDFLYRVIHKGKVRTSYLENYIVKMRNGGRSTISLRSNILGNWEIYKVLKENNQNFKLPIMLMRLLAKIGQYTRGEPYE